MYKILKVLIMIFKENVKKISNIKLIYFFPILLAFLILYFFILQLLYIKTPMLFDIGYWIGLSTNFNPLLIEPNVLNSKLLFFYSFFPNIFIFTNNILYFTFKKSFIIFCLLVYISYNITFRDIHILCIHKK